MVYMFYTCTPSSNHSPSIGVIIYLCAARCQRNRSADFRTAVYFFLLINLQMFLLDLCTYFEAKWYCRIVLT